jgi:hypothetical protein
MASTPSVGLLTGPSQIPSSSPSRAPAPARDGTSAKRKAPPPALEGPDHTSSIQPPLAKQQKKELPFGFKFSCPFFKKDPLLYRGCATFHLSRTQDVKYHLARKHPRPEYCPRCNEVFGDDIESRDAHVRRDSCERRPLLPPDGLSERQRVLLSKPVDAALPPDEQWFSIWDVVFPNYHRPASPYLNTEVSEQLKNFREFMITYGPTIFREAAEAKGLTLYLPDLELGVTDTNNNTSGSLLERIIAAGQEQIFQRWATDFLATTEATLIDSINEQEVVGVGANTSSGMAGFSVGDADWSFVDNGDFDFGPMIPVLSGPTSNGERP